MIPVIPPACFSPSVPAFVRKLWVRNGGTLTHTKVDFYKANFFFCAGMDDGWLNELLSRSLIVRHASWVVKCVEDKFLVPIAAYTLDDYFDASQVELLQCVDVRDSRSQTTATGKDHAAEVAHDNNPFNSRKRPRASEHSTHHDTMLPPTKKHRLNPQADSDVMDLEPPTRWDAEAHPRLSVVPSCVPHVNLAALSGDSTRLPSALCSFSASGMKIRFQEASPFPAQRPKPNVHAAFIQRLLATQPRGEPSPLLTLSIKKLTEAPQVKATMFALNTKYLGRTFLNAGLMH